MPRGLVKAGVAEGIRTPGFPADAAIVVSGLAGDAQSAEASGIKSSVSKKLPMRSLGTARKACTGKRKSARIA